jgi:hypothetical protein
MRHTGRGVNGGSAVALKDMARTCFPAPASRGDELFFGN